MRYLHAEPLSREILRALNGATGARTMGQIADGCVRRYVDVRLGDGVYRSRALLETALLHIVRRFEVDGVLQVAMSASRGQRALWADWTLGWQSDDPGENSPLYQVPFSWVSGQQKRYRSGQILLIQGLMLP